MTDRGPLLPGGRRAGPHAVPEREALSDYVERLALALLTHDAVAIRRLLAQPAAARLPREVREEALAFQRLASRSHRAPICTLRFAYRLQQLAPDPPEGGTAVTGAQLDMFAGRPGAQHAWEEPA
jgi:hypothetical protein